MKVAFATQDSETVNAHFGWARAIAIYEVGPKTQELIEMVQFTDEPEQDGNEDKLAPRLEAIKDCAILYVADIGGSGAARVIAKKVHPIKVPEPEAINVLLDKLRDVLEGSPPPWLRKALRKNEPRTQDFYDEVAGV